MRYGSNPTNGAIVPRMSIRVLSACFLFALPGCDDASDDAEPDASVLADAIATDAAGRDARTKDAAPDIADTDAVPPDAAVPDAQPDDGRFRLPRRPTCEGAYEGAVELGVLDDALVEVSGLAASPTTEGVVWAHNDSGGKPELHALRERDGTEIGRLRLDVDAVDWEDVAAAPCPDGLQPCLWVADTGNNLRDRDTLLVYATPEPDASAPFGEVEAGRVWTFPVRYPEETLDSEALVVSRDGTTFWLFEKVDADQARLYRHPGPLANGRAVDLTLVGTLDTPGIPVARGKMITGADLHPSGTRMLLRVYSGSYEFRFGAGGGVDDVVSVDNRVVSPGPLSERQGEAITYNTAGTAVLTASEDPPDYQDAQPLHIYRCTD